MKVVTVAGIENGRETYFFKEFIASLNRYGHTPLLLGTNPGQWKGLGSKPRILKKAIEDGLIEDERMVFADAFDVIFAASPELIEDLALEYFHDKLVLNAERACFPDASLAAKHPPSPTSYRYLNSGFAVGRTEDFLKLLNWIKADEIPDDSRDADGAGHHPNDQDYVMRAFVSGELPMALDTHAILCQALCGVDVSELDFSGDFIANRETLSCPCAFHANGGSKTSGIMEPILGKLGL